MAKTTHRTWHSKLVAPFLQIKMGIYVLILSLLYSLIFGIYLYNSYEEQLFRFEATYQGDNPISFFQQSMQSQYIFAIACLIIVFLLTTIWIVIRRTHRMYGPMVAMGKFIDSMSAGNYTERLKVRTDDDFQELVDSLNRLSERLQTQSQNVEISPKGSE